MSSSTNAPPVGRWRLAPASALGLGGSYLGFIVIREIVWWAADGAQQPWDIASIVVAAYLAVTSWLCLLAGLSLWRRPRSWVFWSVITLVSLPGIALLLRELTDSSHWGGAGGRDFVELSVVAGFLIFVGCTGTALVARLALVGFSNRRVRQGQRDGLRHGRRLPPVEETPSPNPGDVNA